MGLPWPDPSITPSPKTKLKNRVSHTSTVYTFSILRRTGVFRLQKCSVTDTKVMTFTISKCVHNLPQTSILLGKLIHYQIVKKKNPVYRTVLRHLNDFPRKLWYIIKTNLTFGVSDYIRTYNQPWHPCHQNVL